MPQVTDEQVKTLVEDLAKPWLAQAKVYPWSSSRKKAKSSLN